MRLHAVVRQRRPRCRYIGVTAQCIRNADPRSGGVYARIRQRSVAVGKVRHFHTSPEGEVVRKPVVQKKSEIDVCVESRSDENIRIRCIFKV